MQQPKPRIEATHFIEVWSNGCYNNQDPFPYEISQLKNHLNTTRFLYPGLNTVALFLIRKKEPKDCNKPSNFINLSALPL